MASSSYGEFIDKYDPNYIVENYSHFQLNVFNKIFAIFLKEIINKNNINVHQNFEFLYFESFGALRKIVLNKQLNMTHLFIELINNDLFFEEDLPYKDSLVTGSSDGKGKSVKYGEIFVYRYMKSIYNFMTTELDDENCKLEFFFNREELRVEIKAQRQKLQANCLNCISVIFEPCFSNKQNDDRQKTNKKRRNHLKTKVSN